MLLDSLDAESALQRWHRQLVEISDPSFELLAEEFSTLLATYLELRRGGHQFDPGIVAIMTVLERQQRDGETDGDGDSSDFWLDREDSDEDSDHAPDHKTKSGTSDDCLIAMLERRADERRWG